MAGSRLQGMGGKPSSSQSVRVQERDGVGEGGESQAAVGRGGPGGGGGGGKGGGGVRGVPARGGLVQGAHGRQGQGWKEGEQGLDTVKRQR